VGTLSARHVPPAFGLLNLLNLHQVFMIKTVSQLLCNQVLSYLVLQQRK
jgi:hypothetical protein